MNITTSIDGGYWETLPFSVTPMADRDVYTYYYEGRFDDICNYAGGFVVGSQYTLPNDYIGGVYQDTEIVTGVNVTRKVGGMAELQLQFTCLYRREIWNIDFAEVSKDIKTWLVAKATNSNGEIDSSVWGELRKIAQWENQRDNDNWETWSDFLYDGVNQLTGNTKILAEKIMKGVTNYMIYAPVITRTTIRAIAPQVGKIGMRQIPASESGWSGFNNQTLPTYWVQLSRDWLKTAEKSNSNQDGTFGLTEQWQGCDEVDGDLYPQG